MSQISAEQVQLEEVEAAAAEAAAEDAAEASADAEAGTDEPQVPREIQILETAEDIQQRREQVLGRYANFCEATRQRRERLEEARKYMYFKRDADELESWILEKLQTASDESFKDPTNLQVK